MKKPKPLRKGDTIGIVSPAGVVDPGGLEKGVRELEGLGFRVVLGRNVLRAHRYLAGSDQERVEDLHAMFLNPKVRAILCARGGSGTPRLLPLLNPSILGKNPKIFIGSSDVTSLLFYLVQKIGMVAFHGPMVAPHLGRSPSELTLQGIRMLSHPKAFLKPIWFDEVRCLRSGTAEGILIGGCLSLLCAALGTPDEPETEGTILFLEDVNEPPYRIDRMLTQMRLAGKLNGVRGFIFGKMVNCHPGEGENYSLEDVLLDLLKETSGPILFGLPAGHGQDQLMLPLGIPVQLSGEKRTLTLLESGFEEI